MENIKLKSEFTNTMYDVVDEMVHYMSEKQDYKQNDIIKLVTAISKGNYKYITNDNDYRDQMKLLSDYFKSHHNNHLLINFILMKNFFENRNDLVINEMIENQNVKENLIYLLEIKDYDELLSLMESNKKVFLVFAKTYEESRKGKC
ncbi:MAG: hypothetical protein HFH47_02455 [Bacilli bacterium]|nr:hypothetical protein [Bacilli bacterium]